MARQAPREDTELSFLEPRFLARYPHLASLRRGHALHAVLRPFAEAPPAKGLALASRSVHVRVNLRALRADELLAMYLAEERLMESELYKSIFAKGEACGEVRGEARGEARAHASTLVRMLTHRLGAVDPDLRQRMQTFGDATTLEVWTDEVVLAPDEAAVRRVLEKISRALPA